MTPFVRLFRSRLTDDVAQAHSRSRSNI